MSWRPGTTIGPHVLVRTLGEGGMGTVYLARDRTLGRKVAIKRIHTERLSPEARERFLAEARLTASVTHPNVITVYGVGEHEGEPWLALEYVAGRTLRDWAAHQEPGPKEALRWMLQVAEGVAAAHQAGVLHLDIKPQNVLVGDDGRLRVADFGLARPLAGAQDRRAGTPPYMAPEVWRGEQLTEQTDIWALGIMLYELLFGERPFAAVEVHRKLLEQEVASERPLTLPPEPELPAGVRELCLACLHKRPEDRPSAAHLAEGLRRLLDARPADTSTSPFPGLVPLDDQRGRLLGRGPDIERIVASLATTSRLVVTGPTGSGKSSLVLAGVLPRLREQGRWLFLRVTPGSRPAEALVAATEVHLRGSTWSLSDRSAGTEETWESLEERPPDPEEPAESGPFALHLALLRLARDRACRVLLVVDALEEVFSQCEDEEQRQLALSWLAQVGDDPAEPVRVLFTVRDDFLVRTARAFGTAPPLVLVGPPEVERLALDLEAALDGTGRRWEDGSLPRELARQALEASAPLPLLQFVAARLWEHARDGVLTRAALAQLGGLEGALARHADEVIDRLSPSDRRTARDLLLRLLHADGTRRPQARAALLDGLPSGEAVLETLVSARLVVLERDAEQTVATLVHESLVRAWERLQGWLTESQASLVALRRLEQAAADWHSRGQPDAALWTAGELAGARATLAQLDRDVPAQLKSFLLAGEQRLARDQRDRRRLVVAGVTALAALAAAAVVTATRFQEERDIAQQARAVAEEKVALSLATVGLQMLSRGDVPEARAYTRAALFAGDTAAARGLWELTQARLLQFDASAPFGVGKAFFPGERIGVGGSSGEVGYVDAATGTLVPLHRHDGPITGVARLGDKLLAAGKDGRVWLRSLDPSEQGPGELIHEGEPLKRVFGDETRAIGLLDKEDGEGGFIQVFERDGSSWLLETPQTYFLCQVTPDGKHALLLGDAPDLRAWQVALEPGAEVKELGGVPAFARVLAISPDGTLMFAMGRDSVIAKTGSNELVRELSIRDEGNATLLVEEDNSIIWFAKGVRQRFSEDYEPLPVIGMPEMTSPIYATRGESGRVLITNINHVAGYALDQASLPSNYANKGGVYALAAFDDYIIAGDDTKVLTLSRLNGLPVHSRTAPTANSSKTRVFDVSPDGGLLAFNAGTRVEIVTSDLVLRHTVDAGGTAAHVVDFRRDIPSPDGFWELRASDDYELTAAVGRARSEQRRHTVVPINTNITADDTCAGGLRLYGTTSGAIWLDDGTPRQVARLAGAVQQLRFSPDCRSAAASSGSGNALFLWGDFADQEVTNPVLDSPLAWTPDGSLLYVDAGYWVVERTPDGQDRRLARVPVRPLSLATDGETVYVGDIAGTVRDFDRQTGASSWSSPVASRRGEVRCLRADFPLGAMVQAAGPGCAFRPIGSEATWQDGTPIGEGTRFLGAEDDAVIIRAGDWARWVDASGTELRRERVGSDVSAVLAGEGDVLWVGTYNGKLYRLEDGVRAYVSDTGPTPQATSLIVSPIPELLLTASDSGALMAWSTSANARLMTVWRHSQPIGWSRTDDALVVHHEIGEDSPVDLTVYTRDECEVIAEVSDKVWVTWGEHGMEPAQRGALPERCQR